MTKEATPAPAEKAKPVQKAKPKPKPKPVATYKMPGVVGEDLQFAQDSVQAVTGNPFFFTDSVDAKGLSRFQVIDSWWTVCGREARGGCLVQRRHDGDLLRRQGHGVLLMKKAWIIAGSIAVFSVPGIAASATGSPDADIHNHHGCTGDEVDAYSPPTRARTPRSVGTPSRGAVRR